MKNKYQEALSGVRHSDELVERIFEMTVDKKRKAFTKKSLARIIAVAVVAVIVAGVTSVGATNYFAPDNALNQMIELNDKVDYTTLGTEVNAKASSNGLDFEIKQVLCDNNIICIPIKCPKYNGEYVKPCMEVEEGDDPFKIYVNDKDNFGALSRAEYDGSDDFISYDKDLSPDMCYITIGGLRNIRDNTKITVKFTQVSYFDKYEKQCDVTGDWEFNFYINRSNTRKKLDVKDLVFENGEKDVAIRFVISPLGFQYDYRIKHGKEIELSKELQELNLKSTSGSYIMAKHLATSLNGSDMVKITMKDGTVYSDGDKSRVIDSNCSFSSSTNNPKEYGSLNAIFTKAIDVENIKTITILDQVLYEAE